MSKLYLISSLLAFVITILIILICKPFLRKYFLVFPNSRSSHKKAIPTGGGISFVLSSTFGLLILRNYIPLICLPLAIIGFIDDSKNIDFRIRFFIQFITGMVLWWHSDFLINNNIFLENHVLFLSYFLIAFVITSIINFANFVDGIDGLLNLSLIIIFSVSAIKVSPSLWIIVSTLLAFLLFNWNPAKLFMGDVGSTFLGAVFAGTILQTLTWEDSFLLFLPGIPLLSDALICVIRRFFAKQNIFKAHSLHLFQRLYQVGWSHSKISLIYGFAALILAIFSLLNLWIPALIFLVCIYIFAYYLDTKVAVPFKTSLSNSFYYSD